MLRADVAGTGPGYPSNHPQAELYRVYESWQAADAASSLQREEAQPGTGWSNPCMDQPVLTMCCGG